MTKQINLNKTEVFFHHLILFTKAQFSAFIGGLVDFGVMVFLTEIFGIHYLYSLAAGGVIGAIVNFTINRNWTFRANDQGVLNQVAKFSFAVLLSIFFKSLGTYLLTSQLLIDYRISRLVTDAFVCLFFNYTIQRFWVFR